MIGRPLRKLPANIHQEKGLEDLIVEVVTSVPFTFAGQSSPTEPNN